MSDTRRFPFYVIRDASTWSCGHAHRSPRAALGCLAREIDAHRRYGPTGTVLTIRRVTASGSERLDVDGELPEDEDLAPCPPNSLDATDVEARHGRDEDWP